MFIFSDKDWYQIFQKDTPQPRTHSKPLVYKWLRFVIVIHHLRSLLAKNRGVGIMGTAKNGKSTFVKIMGAQNVNAGHSYEYKTTVVTIYPLPKYELSMIDFPGWDENDKSSRNLHKLALEFAEVVVVVFDWQKVNKEPKKLVNELYGRYCSSCSNSHSSNNFL
jgi:RNA polymerase subunit RPABC4/transcription elongation factor Spt4